MYTGPVGYLIPAFFGETVASKAATNMYGTLSAQLTGTFNPLNTSPYTSTLLSLSTANETGLTMFQVLANSYGVGSTTSSLLSAYVNGT